MIHQTLQQIGLSKNEAITYLTLLELGKGRVSTLGQKIKLERNVIRYTCRKLCDMGLLREQKSGSTFYYSPFPPECLTNNLVCKQAQIRKQKNQIEKIIPELQLLYDPSLIAPKINILKGNEGVRQVYEDILIQGEDVCCWTNFHQKIGILGADYIQKYIKRRLEKGVTIYSIEPKNQNSIQLFEIFKQLDCKDVLVDKLELNEGEIRVYGEKIALISFQKSEPYAFLIQSKIMAQMFRGIFWSAYNEAK